MNRIYIFLASLTLSAAFMLPAAPSILRAQAINGDFEAWEYNGLDTSTIRPVGWAADPIGSTRTDRAQTGTYAVRVWNWYYYGKGSVVLGKGSHSWISYGNEGMPIANKPVRLTGHYLYEPGRNNGRSDSGIVMVMLKRYNQERRTYDTVALGRAALPAADAYTPFVMDIVDRMPGVMPDSITMVIISSDSGFCDVDSDGRCCYLSVDDLRLSTAAGTAYGIEALTGGVEVVPNPVRAQASIRLGGISEGCFSVRIYTADGRWVRTLRVDEQREVAFDRAGMPSGAYMFEARNLRDRVIGMGRFVVD